MRNILVPLLVYIILVPQYIILVPLLVYIISSEYHQFSLQKKANKVISNVRISIVRNDTHLALENQSNDVIHYNDTIHARNYGFN